MGDDRFRRILCVGFTCVDVVITTSEYPAEDSDVRGSRLMYQRGGNASNNCTVLTYLKRPCEYFGSFAEPNGERVHDRFYAEFIQKNLQSLNIYTDHCVHHKNVQVPASIIVLCESTGSRTIIHQNLNLPELTFEDFQKIDLTDYKWIHFEGRCPHEYKKMMSAIIQWNTEKPTNERITISLELESLRRSYDELTPLADLLFVSKDLAKARGLGTKEKAISQFWLPMKERATLIFPWGEEGAIARNGQNREIIAVAAHDPPKVMDTLAAGDTFVAAVICALSDGQGLHAALSFGCLLAGTKCGLSGLRSLEGVAFNLYQEKFGTTCS